MSASIQAFHTDSRAEVADETGLLFRFEAQLGLLPVGLTPEGLRMANSYEGTATRGRFAGSGVRGTDHLLLRADGVCVIDAQTLLTRPRGDVVYEHVIGYCLPPASIEMPELETLLDPHFEWPDVDFPILGHSTFRADSRSDADDLNRAIARIDGWVNFSTGRLVVDTTLIRHDATVDRSV